ncbi:hypothetical protein BU24DRAFT_394460 [Aaosphaeria arxii CBS 175.79]|uniref:Integral membrane protein n=1 Tax=Aaosphaeria arxii CBS 175.79 TaxID=1450172 RepID=A0A6A5XML6_9PLEO|nr:uncharacterized protein BU24DRAFT_394460 [Aaosphaeria arxii CBS 175.79]KAF2013574.1 hypothetical protein BU24DRAFT_394460 [Aaosphaeria arxii CBS 175.79]
MADNNDPQRPAATHTTTTTTNSPQITTTTTFTTAGPRTTVTSDGPQSTATTHPTVTTTHRFPLAPSPQPPPAALPPIDRHNSIRIRRQGSTHPSDLRAQPTSPQQDQYGNRRRSSSEPQRPPLSALFPSEEDDLEIQRHATATAAPLQTLHEEGAFAEPSQFYSTAPAIPPRNLRRPGWGRQLSSISLRQRAQTGQVVHPSEYDADFVDVLDVLDPEISTLTTLNNVQNSLFIPNFGSFYRRQPVYELSASTESSDGETGIPSSSDELATQTRQDGARQGDQTPERPAELGRLQTTDTITSVLTSMSEGQGHNYAVLPHGASLPGWTREEKAALNDHVRHLLHSRRARFKRSMRGFGRYVRKPVGFLVTLYAFLLFFWGAAWVLFLIGWLSVEGRQAYFIEICDQILTALFCVVGIGFAPWRAVDTYHMIYVAYYAHRTWRLRKEQGLPDLRDRNELPSQPDAHAWEKGEDVPDNEELTVLTAEQQTKLEHHQQKLANSHTFYKPHETNTHYAFSVRLLIAIVVLLDCHSLFQMALGGTTWGIYYKNRPKALTAVILSCSISCNISAGITISVGDKRSRKKLVVEQMFRQGLTEEALEKLRKERGLKAKGISATKKGKKGKKGKEKEKDKEEAAPKEEV